MGTLPRRAGLAEPAPPTPRGMAPGAGDPAARVARATAPARWPAPGLWTAAGPAARRRRGPGGRTAGAGRPPPTRGPRGGPAGWPSLRGGAPHGAGPPRPRAG